MRRAGAIAVAGVLAAGLTAGGGGPAAAASCEGAARVAVPGAERQEVSCLVDLTTKGTVPAGRSFGSHVSLLHVNGTAQPAATVPGLQVDGYFPDTSHTNTTFGWNHDSQFVLRLPDDWNGGLVVAGTPGNRMQFANDVIIGDTVVAKGYAYAATDKGNTGPDFWKDGAAPGDAVAEWHLRLTELTRAAKQVAQQVYGRAPSTTLVTGLSNGGYLVRKALEDHPELYEGGVDGEGTLFTADGPNLFTYLPTLLRAYPEYADGTTGAKKTARRDLLAAGLPAATEAQWPAYAAIYWDLTQRIFREEFDPAFDGGTPTAGTPGCTKGVTCDARYDYRKRPAAVHDAVARVSLDGGISDPLVTVHGTADALLPIGLHGDVYARMVQAAGKGDLHRYYRVEGATHVDGLLTADIPSLDPVLEPIRQQYRDDRLRPLLPCYRQAFDQVERWVRDGVAPPPSGTIGRRPAGDEVNAC
ncbi:MAG: D-(-)-3-hydroxybutyrate oligomer hydrolase [Frankiales bacterium]|nr:D-(-)-3-hydroxybutyrate oligomer hydrolase [Frankiales bacterium]